MRAKLPYINARRKIGIKPLKRNLYGRDPLLLTLKWPLKKTMDQESMTAFGFSYIDIFLAVMYVNAMPVLGMTGN